jgi:putative N6-adenine-specific DNA methylase
MAQFFVSCAIGFEKDLLEELQTFWFEMMDLDGQPTRSTLQEFEIVPGGIEIETEEHLGYQINFFSKLANRVLIRIAKFEARYFDQLEKEFKKIDLEKWLEPQALELKIEAHKSRINNQKSIEEALTQILKDKKFKVDAEAIQVLFLRNEKDRITISLNTSGEHLHRRGYATFRGEAPLRETFSAYLYKQLLKSAKTTQNLTLIDPFVGSGTLLFEAQSEKMPLFKRSYSWLSFKNRPKLFKSETWVHNYKWLQESSGINCFGFDFDPKAILNVQKNEAVFNEIFPKAQSRIRAVEGDSLKVDLSDLKKAEWAVNQWLVTNPPYGHRLEEGSAVAILERFERELPLQGLIVLHPESWSFKFQKLKLVSKNDFNNQGLRLKLSVYSL